MRKRRFKTIPDGKFGSPAKTKASWCAHSARIFTEADNKTKTKQNSLEETGETGEEKSS